MYYVAMYDITAVSRESTFVNRCDLENLRHARLRSASRASIKGIVRTRAGVTETSFCSFPTRHFKRRFLDSVVLGFSINDIIRNWSFIHFTIVDLAYVNFWKLLIKSSCIYVYHNYIYHFFPCLLIIK